MGLDGVEIVMEVEDEFGIKIPDEHVSNMTRVGDLIRYVYGRLQVTSNEFCGTARAFHTFRRTIVEKLGVERSAVTLDAALGQLIPGSKRTQMWQILFDAGFFLPGLVRSKRVNAIAACIGLAAVLWLSVAAVPTFGSTSLFVNVPLLLVSAYLIAFTITRPLANHFPSTCDTVRKAIRCYPNACAPSTKNVRCDRDSVSLRIRNIIAEQMGVKLEHVTEDMRFGADLHIE